MSRAFASRIDREYKVATEDLRWTCDPKQLPFKSTEELPNRKRILGQNKALKALIMGLEMDKPGYNIFICGLPGTGRKTALRHALRKRHPPVGPFEDLVCLPRFNAPDRLRFLAMEPGEGKALKRDTQTLFRQIMRMRDRVSEDFRHEAVRRLMQERLPDLIDRYGDEPRLREYFRKLGVEVVNRDGEIFEEDLGINLLSSRRLGQTPPVCWPSPISFGGLFGSYDKQRADEKRPAGVPVGSLRPGALVEARGGYLVLSAAELLEVPNAWNALKNCLLTGTLNFYDNEGHGISSGGDLGRSKIPLSVKVILVGDFHTYDVFMDTDPEFARAFRVRVDFDLETQRSARVVRQAFPSSIVRIVRDEGLRHLNAPAVAKVIEFAVRRAGRKSKISVQFSAVADLLCEANYWADQTNRRVIGAREIDCALKQSVDRLNLLETKISEMISDGVILIDTKGSRVGQVNGLAVYDQGDYLFGKPSRITAETSMGRSGIINIERESGLSGRSHDKGIQILGGYLRSHFAQKRPLSLTASVCFEQSYQGVDGDSASATEIYAILSSLSGLPIRQDIAVTGSLNQKGDIQPIGGVNEKIEGFFDCVMASRSTGREGVIIPRRNVPDLMLREDVVRAAKKGRFSVYAIDRVEEGIEILTGMPAGGRKKGSEFPEGSVFHLVDSRLAEIAEGMREFPDSPRA